jgi:hypothetical protein
VDEKLRDAIEAARTYAMSAREHREQVISFAYANLAIDDPCVDRESVAEAYDAMFGGADSR